MKDLNERIEKLPPELQTEVEDFIEFLLARSPKPAPQKPKLDWAGALKDLRSEYTSVSLQHKIRDMWLGEE